MDTTIELTNRMIAEAAGWRNITDDGLGERPEHYGFVPIPDYLHDATAALSLIPRGVKYHLYYDPDKGYSAVWEGVPAWPWLYYPSLSEAVCQSFMAWKRAWSGA